MTNISNFIIKKTTQNLNYGFDNFLLCDKLGEIKTDLRGQFFDGYCATRLYLLFVGVPAFAKASAWQGLWNLAFLVGVGVELVVDVAEAFVGYVGVDLGGGDVGVA